MAKHPAMLLWTDAYIADTLHLSCLESGAYLHLLMAAWRSPDCSLPNDDKKLSRMARCTNREWGRVKKAVLALWTLDEKTNLWTQKRLLTERKRAHDKSMRAVHANKAKQLKNNETASRNGDAKETGTSSLGPPLPNNLITNNQVSKEKNPSGSKRKASRLPSDWMPSTNLIAWAEKNLPGVDTTFETDQFRDYWAGIGGQRGCKLDWDATWRNWLRRARGSPARRPGGKTIMEKIDQIERESHERSSDIIDVDITQSRS